MTRILLAAATVAGALLAPSTAHACELQYCSWAKPVCDRVNCADPLWYCLDTGQGPICF
jgi:hypothetical protein